MACPDNNKPCGCNETNECGCKIDAKEVVYIGPLLNCTNVNNCDKLNDIIANFDAMLCSDEFIQTLINNILNNVNLYNQFATIINNSISCETIQDCITTTTTTTCSTADRVDNGMFNGDLSSWNNTIVDNWVWSSFNGGSANYIGADEGGTLYQDILVDGNTFDITFDLAMLQEHLDCSDSNYNIFVYAGSTVYGPIRIYGSTTINLIMTSVGGTIFGIQGFENCSGAGASIFVSNVTVKDHCDSFTTTTTTTIAPTTTTTTTVAPFFKLNLDTFTYGSLALACAGSFSVDTDLYSKTFDLNVGDFVYLDDALTMPYDGSDKIFQLRKLDLSFVAVQISSVGEILSILTC